MAVNAYITLALAAALSGQSTSDISRLIYSGTLKLHLVNGRFLIDRAELMALPFSQGGMGAEAERDEEEAEFTVLEPVAKPSAQLARLARDIAKQIDALQVRKRKRKQADEAYFMASLLSFVDAIATVAQVRIAPHGGLNVTYADGKYTGSRISSTQLLSLIHI